MQPLTRCGRASGHSEHAHGCAGRARSTSPLHDQTRDEEECVAASNDRGGIAGISLGGIIVIVGIVLMIVWSFWIGLIIALIGLIAFGGFARGKWY
jgi:hypothetical protein